MYPRATFAPDSAEAKAAAQATSDYGSEVPGFLARNTTPFTARIRASGMEDVPFMELRNASPGLFVMGVTVQRGDLDGEAQVVVLPDGGDFGDVRVLQLERPSH